MPFGRRGSTRIRHPLSAYWGGGQGADGSRAEQECARAGSARPTDRVAPALAHKTTRADTFSVAHLYRDALVPGGIPHQTRQLIEAQVALGVRVSVIARAGQNIPASARVHTLGGATRGFLFDARTVHRTLREDAVDVFHITGLSIPEHVLPVMSVLRSGTPLVLSPHGLLAPLGRAVRFEGRHQTLLRETLKRAFRRSCDRMLIDRAAVIHAQSVFEEECVRAIRPDAEIVIAPMGVDADWIHAEAPRRHIRRPVTIGYLGRLDVYHKGLDLLLEAVRRLGSSSSEFRIIIAGTPVEASYAGLLRSAQDVGVSILPEQWGPDKDRFFRECDFVFGVYRYAGMARLIGESVGRGIPVIASREGNWGDWTAEFGMGVPSALSAESVESALLKIGNLKDDEYERMSARAMAFASTWSWERVAEEIGRAYAAACAGAFKPMAD